ncbi:MAG: redoxin domain-containing protein [Ginsengibacter sp.]
MKLIFSFLLFSFAFTIADAQGYKVILEAPQYKSGIAYLTYYYGKNMNVQDSAAVNSKGQAVFQGKDKILPGVYSVVFPGKSKLFDFLIANKQIINISVPDTSDMINKTKVTGAEENDLFEQYQKYVMTKGESLQKELEAFKTSKTKADSLSHENKYKELNKELNDYRDKLIKDHPESMLATLLTSMKPVEVLNSRPITHQDSLANYEYYKKHYWDGITFMDDRIIRTPFFLPKLENYFRSVISPVPDSIIKESDYLLLLARSSPEMYKFLLNWFTDEYISPKYMGQDAVFVHLFEKYHSKGVSSWLNAKQIKTISDRAYMLMSNLIGDQAANLEMVDSNGVSKSLYNIKADYTVVCFWDPTCGHCRVQVPRLDSIYDAKWKKEGVKMYGVLTETKDFDQWKEFINENKMNNWVNVYETDAQRKIVQQSNQPSYKQLYDVIQTPTLYLLDKDKKIIAKKLTMEQMDEVLDVKIKNQTARAGK